MKLNSVSSSRTSYHAYCPFWSIRGELVKASKTSFIVAPMLVGRTMILECAARLAPCNRHGPGMRCGWLNPEGFTGGFRKISSEALRVRAWGWGGIPPIWLLRSGSPFCVELAGHATAISVSHDMVSMEG